MAVGSVGSEHPDIHVGRVGRTELPQKKRAVSSVGSEHLVYTQGVGSSSLSPPTKHASPGHISDRDFFVGATTIMQHWIYIIYSETRDRYNIGASADPTARLERHNNSRKGFTASGQPWRLVYSEAYSTKSEALKRERQLKSWKNRHRIEALILSLIHI